AASAEDAFDRAGLARAAATLAAGSPTDRRRAETVHAWLADPAARPDGLAGAYGRVFVKDDGEPKAAASLITKAMQQADPGALAALQAEQQRIVAMHGRLAAVRARAATVALLRVGHAVLARYGAAKRARALLDYDDLILLTRTLLEQDGGVGWVHYKLDGGIDHLLVDEAQDTNPAQWKIVANLADEFFAGVGAREGACTVFAVGDEKQSIYGFQGADPDAFAGMRAHFAARAKAAGAPFIGAQLAQSRRSVPAVLETVDRVFAAPAARPGVVGAAEAIRHVSARDGQGGLVELWPAIKPEPADEPDPWDAPLDKLPAESPPAKLARRIAEIVGGWIDGGEMLESQGRPIGPGDVMILVRRRTRFAAEMVRCLKDKRIEVAGSDRMKLLEQIAVEDLMALGAFLLHPEDDLTLAALLRSPLVGLTEDHLFTLAHARRGTLWQAMAERSAGDPAIAAARESLAALLARVDYARPFELYSDVLGRLGGRKRLAYRLGQDALDPIEEFLGLALAFEREHPPSLQGFLHWIEAGATEIKRDLEHAPGKVRVMTVHGAKGLEANVVILPDTCAVPDGTKEERLVWPGEDAPPLWTRAKADETPCTKELRAASRARLMNEYRRLLYVAMTRARDRLYVAGYETKRPRSGDCWYDLVEAALRAHPDCREVDL
ncbi:MAG: double-strand break repair helicase AddA, partial [Alphaproteobacteria bacterium]|nr:double-strand break repair helicase AddA [Alphaproteobacteria bacterium]